MPALKKENQTKDTMQAGPSQNAPSPGNLTNRTEPNANLQLVIAPTAKSPETKAEEVTRRATPKKVISIESKEHFATVLGDAGDKYVMVEFFANWCSPCKIIGMKLEELAEEYRDKVIIAKIDVDVLEELAIEHDVTSMPAFMIMKNYVKVEQYSGSKVEMVEAFLNKYMAQATE